MSNLLSTKCLWFWQRLANRSKATVLVAGSIATTILVGRDMPNEDTVLVAHFQLGGLWLGLGHHNHDLAQQNGTIAYSG